MVEHARPIWFMAVTTIQPSRRNTDASTSSGTISYATTNDVKLLMGNEFTIELASPTSPGVGARHS
jgi:hypothetical protein